MVGTAWAVVLLSMGERVLGKAAFMWVRVREHCRGTHSVSSGITLLATGFNSSLRSTESHVVTEAGKDNSKRSELEAPSARHSGGEQHRGSLGAPHISFSRGFSLSLVSSVDSLQTSASAPCKALCFPW